jgi:riboflavin kinase/FMN adenylyltransferase
MKLTRGIAALRPEGAAVTIGNFDGVHLGHRSVLQALRAAGPAVALCFEPTPLEHFQPDRAPARLTRFIEKHAALAGAGCDHMAVLRFDANLSTLAPEAFVERVLVRGLGATKVLVGADFRFGRDRTGDLDLLARLGQRHGFSAEAAPELRLDGERVSSTRVRERLAAGDLDGAARLLGRRYSLCGRVMRGDALGRTLGVPTVNLPLRRAKSPLHGVYLVQVHGIEDGPRWGAANVGTRPAVGGVDWRCEAHILDYEGDLYGRRLEIEFHVRLRDEQGFPTLSALTRQMKEDIEQARAIVAKIPLTPALSPDGERG